MSAQFIVRGTDYVKAAFVLSLRKAFNAQPFFPIYKYDDIEANTKISIFSTFPKQPLTVPAIIVSTSGGSFSRSTLDSEDLLHDNIDSSEPESFTAWGKLEINAVITIYALTDRDRSKLTDLTALFCRHLFINKFASLGIGYSEVTVRGEGTMDWQHQILYTNSISIPCYTEFQVSYPVELIDVINNINISIINEL